jgi:hypothetical protein
MLLKTEYERLLRVTTKKLSSDLLSKEKSKMATNEVVAH